VPLTDWTGKPKNEMERRIEEYECAESVLLIKTFNGIRQKLMARELEADKKLI